MNINLYNIIFYHSNSRPGKWMIISCSREMVIGNGRQRVKYTVYAMHTGDWIIPDIEATYMFLCHS